MLLQQRLFHQKQVNSKLKKIKNFIRNDEKKKAYSAIKLLLAVFLALGSVVYIMYRGASDRAYKEKWQDYDECGLS